MTPLQRPSAEGPEAGTLSARLTADHGEIDGLFHDAQTAMDRGLPADAHAALDEVWMRPAGQSLTRYCSASLSLPRSLDIIDP